MKLKGLMKAALARSNELLANDALRLLSRLMRKRGLIMEPTAFKGISQRLLESALMMQCPDIDQVEARDMCHEQLCRPCFLLFLYLGRSSQCWLVLGTQPPS